MLTSNQIIDKIESMPKIAIRLLIGLTRISHTAEAFWASEISEFLMLWNFYFNWKKFKKDFILLKNIKSANFRQRIDFNIPRVKSIKIGLFPPYNFPKIWHENKRHFSKLSNINLILNFKQNLIEDFYPQNKCFNSNTCYDAIFAKESKKAKTILLKKD